jgi:hypothetical protein
MGSKFDGAEGSDYVSAATSLILDAAVVGMLPLVVAAVLCDEPGHGHVHTHNEARPPVTFVLPTPNRPPVPFFGNSLDAANQIIRQHHAVRNAQFRAMLNSGTHAQAASLFYNSEERP